MEVWELLEVLNSARVLLADKGRWSPMHIATDEDGHWVPVGNGNAARFNLLGAVIRAAGFRARDAMKTAERALLACSSETFARTLSSPRPMRHAEALAWLEAAISALTAQMHGEARAPARSTTGDSGVMRRVSEADAIARQTTGTDDDEGK